MLIRFTYRSLIRSEFLQKRLQLFIRELRCQNLSHSLVCQNLLEFFRIQYVCPVLAVGIDDALRDLFIGLERKLACVCLVLDVVYVIACDVVTGAGLFRIDFGRGPLVHLRVVRMCCSCKIEARIL